MTNRRRVVSDWAVTDGVDHGLGGSDGATIVVVVVVVVDGSVDDDTAVVVAGAELVPGSVAKSCDVLGPFAPGPVVPGSVDTGPGGSAMAGARHRCGPDGAGTAARRVIVAMNTARISPAERVK